MPAQDNGIIYLGGGGVTAVKLSPEQARSMILDVGYNNYDAKNTYYLLRRAGVETFLGVGHHRGYSGDMLVDCYVIGPDTNSRILDNNAYGVDAKDIPYVRRLMDYLKVGVAFESVSSEGLITQDNKLYVVSDLPKDFHVEKGILEIEGFHPTKDGKPLKSYKLPPGLKVWSLRIDDTPLAEISPRTQIANDLSINTAFEVDITLPAYIKIGGSLRIGGGVASLPAGLKVGRDLILEDWDYTAEKDKSTWTHLESLPENLKVGGNLELGQSDIHKLPSGLKVGGDLLLNKYVELKDIPVDAVVRGNVVMADGTKFPGKLLNERRAQAAAKAPEMKLLGPEDKALDAARDIAEKTVIGDTTKTPTIESPTVADERGKGEHGKGNDKPKPKGR